MLVCTLRRFCMRLTVLKDVVQIDLCPNAWRDERFDEVCAAQQRDFGWNLVARTIIYAAQTLVDLVSEVVEHFRRGLVL